jgi:hypothetical protein
MAVAFERPMIQTMVAQMDSVAIRGLRRQLSRAQENLVAWTKTEKDRREVMEAEINFHRDAQTRLIDAMDEIIELKAALLALESCIPTEEAT